MSRKLKQIFFFFKKACENLNLKTESYLSALQRLAKPSHFDSVSQTHCFKELHNAFLKPIWVPKTLTFWASVSLKTTMSASKAKSTRKHQRSESEFAVSDKRNRVEDDFDLDLSKLVTSNTILLLLLFLCLKIFFVRFFDWDLRLKKENGGIAVISKALCRRCIRSERRLRRTARRRTKRLFPGNTNRFAHSD